MTGEPAPPSARQLPRHGRWLFRLFAVIARRQLKKCFHAVRLSGGERLPADAGCPLVIYLNHPSWWDPLICIELARQLLPERNHYAPMESDALEQYPFFERLGMFPVDPSFGGVKRFLRYSRALLEREDAVLWVTPEGRFVDPREQPDLAPGLAHLLAKPIGARVVPLAIELPFWEEKQPEVLCRFGRPLQPEVEGAHSTRYWNRLLSERLREAQDELAAASLARQSDAFEVILSGRVGVGGIYDLWRRLKAWLRFRRPRLQHGREES